MAITGEDDIRLYLIKSSLCTGSVMMMMMMMMIIIIIS